MSLKKSRTSGITVRLLFWIMLLLSVSLICVSGTVYYLLSNSLRKSDQELIIKLAQTYAHTYKEGGSEHLKEDISPEVMVSILDKGGKTIFLTMPSYIDHDFEDEEEILQIKQDTEKLPLKEGVNTILLLSGEEDTDILHQWEFSLRQFALEKNWTSILPLIDNDMVEIYTMPIHDGQWIRVGRSSEEREEHLARIRNISLIVLIPFLVIGFILSFILSRSILAPVNDLVSTIKRIKAGEASARAKVKGSGDEVDILGDEFNLLLDHNEKLVENLKSSIDNVAHDLRTPLTRFRISAEEALNKNSPEAYKEAVHESLESSENILNLLNAIMDVSESETKTMKLKPESIQVKDFFDELIDVYSYLAEDKHIRIQSQIDSSLCMRGDRFRLNQVFGNLLDNALKFSSPETIVEITAVSSGSSIIVSVKDQGAGIASEDVNKIWDRLFRGDKSRSTPGLGIGLSVVKAIVHAHQGQISVVSSLNQGSTFIVSLPSCNV